MAITQIDVSLWNEMLIGGYRNLKRNMAVIDELNVFPVPDGDTGKNMTMTIEGGVLGTQASFGGVGELLQRFSRASLMSARGNSGVILSQFVRGLAEGSREVDTYTADTFTRAFEQGKECAYRAVAKPVEGTMLTLLREGTEFLKTHPFTDLEECFIQLIAELRRSLQRTPELLPTLKEAGVVDSGGAGLVCIFEGMLAVLQGDEVEEAEPLAASDFALSSSFDENSVLEFGYCTEFVLQLLNSKTDIPSFSLDELRAWLEANGDSVVTVRDESIIKVHVHTFEPERILGHARRFGEFVTVKIENMSVQHNETQGRRPAERKKYAVVATAAGEGIIDFFKNVGVDEVIDGGRTNNPSTEDFIAAFDRTNAEYIVVLPNDANVILAAKQAAELYDGADVRVIETRSIAEGFSALSMMDLSAPNVEQLIADMTFCLPNVNSGYISRATRDAFVNRVRIQKDDWLGFDGDLVYAAAETPIDAAMQLFAALPNIAEKQVVTVFYGKDVPQEEVTALETCFLEVYPLIEIGFIDGKQDIYRYIFAIE